MASTGPTLPEKQLQCPLCSLIFTDPVTTPCGHNFCQTCLQKAWDSCENICQCPTCSKTFSPSPEISINMAFKVLADSFKNMVVCETAAPLNAVLPGDITCDVCAAGSVQVKAQKSCLVCLTSYCPMHLEPHRKVSSLQVHKLIDPVGDLQKRLCPKHGRLLEMFCKDEQKCVCQFCMETEHKSHKCVSVEEESRSRKDQIVNAEAKFTNMIKERLKKEEEILNCLQLGKESVEKKLKAGGDLFSSLMDSVKDSQSAVTEEILKEQTSAETRAANLAQDLREEVQQLESRSKELEELRNTEDHLHLLQRLPAVTSDPASKDWSEISLPSELGLGTMRSALSKLQEALDKKLDTVKNEEMKMVLKYAVDVVLDPDTAHPNIVLSPDGKQAGRGELLHVVPDNPQRFDPVICVLAKRGFVSGCFYFQVSVGSKTYWDLGVVLESVNRKGMITSKPENGFWTVRLRGGDEYRALDSPSVLLQLRDRPQAVGVFTDYDQGTVSFYNATTKAHIYSFTGCSFTQRVFPFFSPGVCDEGKNVAPLIVMPVNAEI